MITMSKLLRASPGAKSRVHDLQGNSAPIGRIAVNYPRAIWSRVMLTTMGKSPVQPWISYDATKRLDAFMAEAPRSVLEFGSGNSTIWFAKRAAVLHTVEHNAEWHRRVQGLLAGTSKRGTVIHELREREEDYTTFRANSDQQWDIILIDGIWRLPVARYHVDKLAPSGILYLDNSDAETSTDAEREIPELLVFLDEWAQRTNRKMQIYTDFSPTVLHATQGRLYSTALA